MSATEKRVLDSNSSEGDSGGSSASGNAKKRKSNTSDVENEVTKVDGKYDSNDHWKLGTDRLKKPCNIHLSSPTTAYTTRTLHHSPQFPLEKMPPNMNSPKTNAIPSRTMTSTAEEETGGNEKHDFPGYNFIVNVGSWSWHQRVCEKCGLAQKYGRGYGSNKHPGYKRVDPKCPGKRASKDK